MLLCLLALDCAGFFHGDLTANAAAVIALVLAIVALVLAIVALVLDLRGRGAI